MSYETERARYLQSQRSEVELRGKIRKNRTELRSLLRRKRADLKKAEGSAGRLRVESSFEGPHRKLDEEHKRLQQSLETARRVKGERLLAMKAARR